MCQKDTRTVQNCRWSQLDRISWSRMISGQNTFVGSLKCYWIFCSIAQECVVNQLIWRNCDWAVPAEEGKLHSMFCFVKIVLPENKSCRSSVVHQSISILCILKDNFRRPYLTNDAPVDAFLSVLYLKSLSCWQCILVHIFLQVLKDQPLRKQKIWSQMSQIPHCPIWPKS